MEASSEILRVILDEGVVLVGPSSLGWALLECGQLLAELVSLKEVVRRSFGLTLAQNIQTMRRKAARVFAILEENPSISLEIHTSWIGN
jgi:hypothetical protein